MLLSYCVYSRFSQMAGSGAVVGSGGGQLPGYGQQSVGLGRQSSAGGSQGVSASYMQQQRHIAEIRQRQQQQQMVQQNPSLMHRQMSANAQQQQQQQQNNQFTGYPPYRWWTRHKPLHVQNSHFYLCPPPLACSASTNCWRVQSAV